MKCSDTQKMTSMADEINGAIVVLAGAGAGSHTQTESKRVQDLEEQHDFSVGSVFDRVVSAASWEVYSSNLSTLDLAPTAWRTMVALYGPFLNAGTLHCYHYYVCAYNMVFSVVSTSIVFCLSKFLTEYMPV